MESRRTSPAAKTPGTLVSSAYGARASGQCAPSPTRSVPVTTKPLASRITSGPSQSVRGEAPMNTNSQDAGTSSVTSLVRSDRTSDSR